jgi:hypothetical protein
MLYFQNIPARLSCQGRQLCNCSFLAASAIPSFFLTSDVIVRVGKNNGRRRTIMKNKTREKSEQEKEEETNNDYMKTKEYKKKEKKLWGGRRTLG